jgi:hypothetical protein
MKKLFLALLMILIMATSAFPAGTASVTNTEKMKVLGEFQRIILTITWVDDTAGTTLAINPATYGIQGWYIVQAETTPSGVTAPTDLYDITLVSASGFDLSLGTLMNRSETATERVSVSAAGVVYPIMIETFTFTLSGNAVNNATGTLKLIFSAN